VTDVRFYAESRDFTGCPTMRAAGDVHQRMRCSITSPHIKHDERRSVRYFCHPAWRIRCTCGNIRMARKSWQTNTPVQFNRL